MIAEKLEEVLKDLSVDKETRECFCQEKIAEFFDTFLRNNIFLTRKALTGDFLNQLGFKVYRGSRVLGDLRRVLSYSFKTHVMKAVKKGKIYRYNTNCYKVV